MCKVLSHPSPVAKLGTGPDESSDKDELKLLGFPGGMVPVWTTGPENPFKACCCALVEYGTWISPLLLRKPFGAVEPASEVCAVFEDGYLN